MKIAGVILAGGLSRRLGGGDKCLRLLGGPIEGGENAGERPGEAGDAVGNDRQREGAEARGIAIGVKRERVHLRPKPVDDVREDGSSAEKAQAFVTPAETAR